MNQDLKKAKELLNSSRATCVLCYGEEVCVSEQTGIAPMMGYISNNKNLTGFSAADKIIGKAAALLFALAGVRAVYGEVMSRAALPVLERYGIVYEYGILADYIVNRTGDGTCPMEIAVQSIDDPEQGYKALSEELCRLRRKA